MKYIKILYARTQFWFNLKSGGSVGHTLGVLNGLRQNNCKIKIISNERFLGIDDFNYTVIEPKIKKPLGQFLYNFYAKNRFKKEIPKFKPDFIYHRYTGYTFFVTKIAKKLKIPLILEFNSFDTWKLKYWIRNNPFWKKFFARNFKYHIVKYIENYNLKHADLIVVVSEPLRDDLVSLGIPKKKILFIPNGVDPDKFNLEDVDQEECEKLKKDLGIDENKLIVGFVGTFGPWHGIPQLTQAVDRISKSKLFSNIHFLLIGDGDLKRESENQIGQYKEVTFIGEVSYSDVQHYLAVCDILVSPHCPQVDGREFFGSPTKLFEYMAMGKPIIASRLGQIGDVLEHKKTAYLVEPGNVENLAEAMNTLIMEPGLCNVLGQNARAEVLSKYTWEKHVWKIIEKLKEQIKTS